MLQRIFISKKSSFLYVVLLLCAWLGGSAAGVALASASFPSFSDKIYSLVCAQRSPVLYWLTANIPLAATLLCMHFRFRAGVCLIAFFKALTYAFSAYLIYNAFGSAGWLFFLLCMPANTLCCLLLFDLWLKLSTGVSCSRGRITAYFVGYSLPIILDHFLIAPFIVSVLT